MSLVMSRPVCFNTEAIAALNPFIEETEYFRSLKCTKKSATSVTAGLEAEMLRFLHQFLKNFHLAWYTWPVDFLWH